MRKNKLVNRALLSVLAIVSTGGFAKDKVNIGESIDSGNAVIFFVDSTGKHGLAASTQDEATTHWEGAKSLCASKGLNWKLPTKAQLSLLWNFRYVLDKNNDNGGFANRYYWSSSQVNGAYSWVQSFYNGTQDTLGKQLDLHVRCVKSF